MNTYLKITLKIPEFLQELFISEFDHIPFTGFEQREGELDAYILANNYSEKLSSEITEWLDQQAEGKKLFSLKKFDDQNWNENWEKTIQPISVGRFIITPSWSETYKDHPELIPVFIDPKMAFGTGYHETTRLILRLLPDVTQEGIRVLDVGTGTGILAIGALKLGAKKAIGVDIDDWCFENAHENAQKNNVSEKLIIRIGSLEAIPVEEKKPFELVLANINRNALMNIAADLVSQVAPGGFLVLSGLLKEDEFGILEHPVYRKLKFVKKASENDWIALIFKIENA